MFERFTERARQAVVLAQEEARKLKHNYIGTEHILLGLLREEEEVAAQVLESLGVTLEEVRARVVRSSARARRPPRDRSHSPHGPRRYLELALREALTLSHNYIGTEHILLGLVRENEGIAARVLVDLNADAETIRAATVRRLGPRDEPFDEPTTAARPAPRRHANAGWLEGLGDVLEQLAAEIHATLDRDPDAGDLLPVLASMPSTTAAGALQELGVNLDALAETIERHRRENGHSAASGAALREVRRRLGLNRPRN